MRLVLVMIALGSGVALVPQPESTAARRPGLTTEQVRELAKRSLCGNAKSGAGQDTRASQASASTAAPPALLPGYGAGGFDIHTTNPQAQAYFDNGLQLAHAFSHDEAVAAMRESVRLDPGCAMCLWGEAHAAGPTINSDVSEEDSARFAANMARAQRLSRQGRPRERALIAAMAARYRDGGGGGPGDLAFARAMDAIAEAAPGDNAVQTIAADAWMIYAIHSGARQHHQRAKALLERVLTRDPDYVPAIHFYIHVTEMTGNAGLAERYADRLPVLAPAASHLVHMPSHTFYRVGRYQDAADANKRAVEIGIADAARMGLPPQDVWDLPYHGHNVHFGVGGALISGDGTTALALGRPVLAASREFDAGVPSAFQQMVMGTALFAEGRFAPLEQVLGIAELPESWSHARAYWRYARGEALARAGNLAAVRAEIAAMPQLTDGPEVARAERAATRMAQIARLVLEGRAAMLEDRPLAALAAYWRAAQLQERPSFAISADPPLFWYPVRRDVAAVLLRLNLHRAAVAEADAVLRDWPNEPMTLATRAAAQQALGQAAAAGSDRRLARIGWRGEAGALLR